MKYRDRIAPGATIVFGLVSEPRIDRSLYDPGEIVGVFSTYDLAKTMELATSLQPDARHLAVVSGASDFDRGWEEKARRVLAPWSASREIRYLTGLAFDDVLGEVSRLSPDTIVLVLTFFEDKDGRRFASSLDAAREIARASAAPSYGPYDIYVGAGFVGAYSDSFEFDWRGTGRSRP